MTGKSTLSIVIPLYQAEELLDELIVRLKHSLNSLLGWKYEIILVDDGSDDGTWRKIEDLFKKNPEIKAFKFSRNFGQHNAITAGLTKCAGEWVVVMDCDLQDRPEEIPKLLNKALLGYNIVLAQRIQRQDKVFKIFASKAFYKFFELISGIKFEAGIANFGIYHRKVINAILKYKENFRPFPIIVKVVGFNRTAIEVQHGRRFSGKSNYNNFGLFKKALNAFIYYSNRPIWIFLIIGLGVLSSMLFIILGMYFMIFQIDVKDLILILILLMSILSLNTSLIGIYVSRVFIESKNRPLYLIEYELINGE